MADPRRLGWLGVGTALVLVLVLARDRAPRPVPPGQVRAAGSDAPVRPPGVARSTEAAVPATGSTGRELEGGVPRGAPGGDAAQHGPELGAEPWSWPLAWDASTPRVAGPRARVVDGASGLPVPHARVRWVPAAPRAELDLPPEAALEVLLSHGEELWADARGELTLPAAACWLHARAGARASAPVVLSRTLPGSGSADPDEARDRVLLLDRWSDEPSEDADGPPPGATHDGSSGRALTGSHLLHLRGVAGEPLAGARLHRAGVALDPLPGRPGDYRLDPPAQGSAPLWAWAPGHAARRLELALDSPAERTVSLPAAPRVALRVRGTDALLRGGRRVSLAARRTVFDGRLRRAEVLARTGFGADRTLELELPDEEPWELWWVVLEDGCPRPVGERPVRDDVGRPLVLDPGRTPGEGPLADLLQAPRDLDLPTDLLP